MGAAEEFIIAQCPTCHSDIHLEDLSEQVPQLIQVAGLLVTHAGAIDMLMHLPEYQGSREGFDERMTEMIDTISKWVEDLQVWGDAFDG